MEEVKECGLDDVYAVTKGQLSEKKVFNALEELKQEGEIKDFGQTFPFSQDDRNGIDFIVITKTGKEVRIQVKSSYRREEVEEYLRKGINYLIPGKDKAETKKRILWIIEKNR